MKQKNSSYKYYLVRLSSTPVSQLVEYFNNEVGSRAWTSERAIFDAALIDVTKIITNIAIPLNSFYLATIYLNLAIERDICAIVNGRHINALFD